MQAVTTYRKRGAARLMQAARAALLPLSLAMVGVAAQADELAEVQQLARTGKLAEALAKADQFLATKPRDPQMRFARAVIQADSGKTAEALVGLQKLIEDFPEIPEPYNNLAALHAADGQYDKARSALEMAIRLNPNYGAAHENLGDVYARLAGQAYGRALQLEPANAAPATKLRVLRELYSGKPAARTAAPSRPAGKTAAGAAATR